MHCLQAGAVNSDLQWKHLLCLQQVQLIFSEQPEALLMMPRCISKWNLHVKRYIKNKKVTRLILNLPTFNLITHMEKNRSAECLYRHWGTLLYDNDTTSQSVKAWGSAEWKLLQQAHEKQLLKLTGLGKSESWWEKQDVFHKFMLGAS